MFLLLFPRYILVMGKEDKKRTEAQNLGGAEDFSVYRRPDTVPYCDKGNHKESSLYHAPQHRDHWKKVEREQRRGQ